MHRPYRLYVASSWRNEIQPSIVEFLRSCGKYDVYDFRNPAIGQQGFAWREIDGGWKTWRHSQYVLNLSHPLAETGFMFDKNALDWCDACVLVMPCGRSAHLELGYCIGKGKPSVIYLPTQYPFEPELMYKLATSIVINPHDLLNNLRHIEGCGRGL